MQIYFSESPTNPDIFVPPFARTMEDPDDKTESKKVFLLCTEHLNNAFFKAGNKESLMNKYALVKRIK